MIAFIAWTPLHIMNIINTKTNYFSEEKSDLYIYGEFSNARQLCESIKEQNLFTNVFFIEPEKIGNKYTKIMNLIINKNNFINYTCQYEQLFIQGENYFSKIIFGQSKKKNTQLILNYIEDGLGAYVGSRILDITNKKNRVINFFNPYSIFKSKLSNCYVYEPNLVEVKENARYHPLKKLTDDNQATSIIGKVFQLQSHKDVFPGKVLYLDQPLESDQFKINEKMIFDEICKLVPKKDLWIKLHPRSSKNKYKDFQVIETVLPWELYFLNYDFSKTTIISPVSTAAFSPKLMMGTHSPVVLLPKVIQNQQPSVLEDVRTVTMLNNIIFFSGKFSQLDISESYLPESIDELKELIRND